MKRHVRYKILLDEMLPRKEKFPVLNKMHQVKHIVHDYHLGGFKDLQVINLAKKLDTIIVTKNIKHFRHICFRENVDLIGITEAMSPEELDKSLVAAVRKCKHHPKSSHFIKISPAPRRKK